MRIHIAQSDAAEISNLEFVSFSHTLRTLAHSHRVGFEAVVVVVVASMWGIASLGSRKRAWVRACICGCMRQRYKYSDAFSSACSTSSVVVAGGRALGRRKTYSHAHTRPASLPNEHLGGRCRAAAGGVGGVREMLFLMLIWLVRWYNIQFPILHDHTEVGGGARANSEKEGVGPGCQWALYTH